jgi:murein DD-endopeptidase MepM/ murein hydrolase activator NlpD
MNKCFIFLTLFPILIQAQTSNSFFKKKEKTENIELDSLIIKTVSVPETKYSIVFLSSPVDGASISSSFAKKRFHPVLKVWKEHKGTDFSAPYGTPIKATSSGVIESTGYTSANGNYVKIRHNETYTTQYLHMSKISVAAGENVLMGDIIGLVGSSGSSTGSHVCYRFWKNGIQINPYEEFNQNFKPKEINTSENEVATEEEIEEIEPKKKTSGFFTKNNKKTTD